MGEWKLFSPQGKLYQTLNRMTDLMIWNFLWILCSLPIITVGASTCALYMANLKQMKKEENGCLEYFKYFKENLVFGILYEMLLIFFIVICTVVSGLLRKTEGLDVIRIFLYVSILLVLMISSYILPVRAFFSGTVLQILKISLYLTIRMPFYFLLKFINWGLPILLLGIFFKLNVTGLIPILLFWGISGSNWLNTKLFLIVVEKQKFVQTLYEKCERD